MADTMPAAGAPSQRYDPFNFPMPNRCDLMSLSVINRDKDLMKTTTSKFVSGRSASLNLHTKDIDGKSFLINFFNGFQIGAVPKLHGNKKVDSNK